MAKNYEFNQEFIEWEFINSSEEIGDLIFENNLEDEILEESCNITFYRNEEFGLKAKLVGLKKKNKGLSTDNVLPAGSFFTGMTINGSSKDKLYNFKFEKVVINNIISHLKSPKSEYVEFEAELSVAKSIERNYNYVIEEANSIHEWYLSGKTQVRFTRSTERSIEKKLKRFRKGIDKAKNIKVSKNNNTSFDSIYVKVKEFSFVITKVPEQFGPKWSYNLAVEYNKDYGKKLPNIEERKAISELIGFIFGNEFVLIGRSYFDKSKNLFSQEYFNPSVNDIFNRCRHLAHPPINIIDYFSEINAEVLLNVLLPEYLKLWNLFGLKDALLKYWASEYIQIGNNLPILSSAVEVLAEKILKLSQEVKSYYIDYKTFISMISEEINEIDKKLTDNKDKTKILNKIKNASQRGSNEKIEQFFKLLNLEIGKVEKKAMMARNKMAHSSQLESTEDEIIEIVKLSSAYKTLFNRIFLKLLNYNYTYIDYYSLGYPSRHIDDPIPDS